MNLIIDNSDILNYVISFIPKQYCLYLNSVSKSFNQTLFKYNCSLCKKQNIFIPIVPSNQYNNIYCIDCYSFDNLYCIDKEDKKAFKFLDKCRKKPIHCKYCNLKCSSIEFAHYHLLFKCEKYLNTYISNINKLNK